MMNSYTLGVLKELERGTINVAKADMRLNAAPLNADAPTFKPELPGWVRWLRLYAFVSGTLTVLFGAWIIVSTVHSNLLWLILGLPITLLGAFVLSFAALFSSMHWIYVHVDQARGRPRAIRFAIPFPFRLLRVGLWLARFVMPSPKGRLMNTRRWRWDAIWQDLHGFLNVLERELREGRGISVNVDDQGQRVQLYWLESNAFRRTANEASHAYSSVSDSSKLSQNRFKPDDEIDNGWRNGWAGF